MRGQEPRSSSSCAACKFMKRRCTLHCLFAPYFRADEPKKFAKVHKVFGASNVTKILNEVPEPQRQDAVNSLVFEAEERLKDPVYGCIGAIASLQDKMFQLQHDLAVAKARLARCSTTRTSYASCSTTTSPFSMLDGDFGMTSLDIFVVDQGCGLTTEFRPHSLP
ncbi:LOB domain-containing protein 21-like [Bidens hawaiensis]|uniref:LOB domain-containing protein 21-like n=1 Tax=Bidens hawaiensis TaxID=980011 RepID=UPI00404BA094